MHRSLCVVALLASLLAGCCCPAINAAREAAKDAQSRNNIMQMGLASHMYHSQNGAWPETLDDLNPYLEGSLAALMVNPVTGDNPGYEYVKPEDDEPSPEVVWIYQLRNGSRDMSLPMGYADGSVR